MAQKIVLLCDDNIHYGKRLSAFLQSKKAFPYTVFFFSEVSQLLSYLSENEGDYLLIASELFREDTCAELMKEKYGFRRIFLLERGKEESESSESDERICRVGRYQSAGEILRRILLEFEKDAAKRGRDEEVISHRETKLIGVYTPIRRCMQTSFSVLLGQALSREARTLYVNMEGCSGFRILLGREGKKDLSDLMFYNEQNVKQFMERLEECLSPLWDLEFIPPAKAFVDLSCVTKEQWLQFIRLLRADGRFGYVILDLNEQIQGLLQILRECDVVYTIESDDRIGSAKIQEYEELLKQMEYEDILKKTRKKQLPKMKNVNLRLDELLYSELAEYVQESVKEGL